MSWYLTGLLGEHIAQSKSPAMHEREAEAHACKLAYQLFDFADLKKSAADLDKMVDAALHMGFAGLNVTHPFKRHVIRCLDEVSAEAAAVGAVNTIVFRAGKKIGFNTDCPGFLKAFEEELGDVNRQRVLLLGAGGAGSAVSTALMQLGVKELYIHDRQETQAQSLVEKLVFQHPEIQVQALAASDLDSLKVEGIINATPVGMREFPGLPLPKACIQKQHWVVDIIYFPLKTALLAHAETVGCRTMNGARMAVYQAAEAFTLFTGLPANRARMLTGFYQQ